MSTILEMVGVRKAFNEGRPDLIWAVDGVDLRLAGEGVTVLAGPSGSGKTTLLSMLGCLARPTEGRVHLQGEAVSSLPEPFLAALRRRSFGFVFQRFHLVRGFSVLENTMLPAYPEGPPYPVLRARAEALLDRLGMAALRDRSVETLSGGQAQRVAIARALINDPPVLIADEPTAHLDSRLTVEFLGMVKEQVDEGRTWILSSHDPRVQGAGVVDRILELRDGRIVADRATGGGAAS